MWPTDGRTGWKDGRTDGPTDIPSYRNARTHLKMVLSILPFWNKHCMYKYTYYMNNCWNRVWEQKHHNICVFLKTETLQYKNGPKKDGHKNTKTCFCNFPTSNKYVCFWRQKHFSTKMALKKKGHKNTKTCFCNLPTCLLSSSKAVESSKGRGPGSLVDLALLLQPPPPYFN